jgi:heat shock protein HtpX
MITKHSVRTVFFMVLVAMLFMLVGRLIGGTSGMMVAFFMAMAMNFFSYWFSDKMVLRMYGAKEVDATTAPELYGMVQELAAKAKLPMPRVYIIPQMQPNAFATGRNPENAAVAVTEGLMRLLPRDEMKGVLAHEVAHILHRDILTQTIVTTMVSAISMIAQLAYFLPLSSSSDDDDGPNPLVSLLLLILAPIAGALLQAAVSRTREYEADRVGAALCGRPSALAKALHRIENAVLQIPMQASSTTAQATAHMFPVNPFSGGRMFQAFSTHPATEERIENLLIMERTGIYP